MWARARVCATRSRAPGRPSLRTGAGPAHLAPLALILAVLGEKAAEEVATATGHVHQRPFLPEAQARGHYQHQGDGLDEQGPLPQVAPDDEAAQDGLDLKRRAENAVERALRCHSEESDKSRHPLDSPDHSQGQATFVLDLARIL